MYSEINYQKCKAFNLVVHLKSSGHPARINKKQKKAKFGDKGESVKHSEYKCFVYIIIILRSE